VTSKIGQARSREARSRKKLMTLRRDRSNHFLCRTWTVPQPNSKVQRGRPALRTSASAYELRFASQLEYCNHSKTSDDADENQHVEPPQIVLDVY